MPVFPRAWLRLMLLKFNDAYFARVTPLFHER